MAQTFFPITPTEITAGSANTWVVMDASALAPANATGVIIHAVNTGAAGKAFGLRKNGSTDDRTYDIAGGPSGSHCWAAIGVDASRYFEAYVESTSDIDIYVVAYTMAGVTFATNATDKSPTKDDTWRAMDCSSEAPSAIGLIFEVAFSGGRRFGLKKNGSTDDRAAEDASNHSCFGVIIGCDGSQICEGSSESVPVFWLVGYITDGATFNTNATDVSLGSTGSYIDLAALPNESPNMGFIEIYSSSDVAYGLRENGQSGGYYDIYQDAKKHPWAIVECDENRLIEGKIENTVVDFFVVGYSTAAAVVAVIVPQIMRLFRNLREQ